jgi:hypothetical protein
MAPSYLEVGASDNPGAVHHRELAAALQHGASARLTRIQATGSGGLRTRYDRAVGSATPTSFAARAGVEAVNALTFHPDHSVGADQLLYKARGESTWRA